MSETELKLQLIEGHIKVGDAGRRESIICAAADLEVDDGCVTHLDGCQLSFRVTKTGVRVIGFERGRGKVYVRGEEEEHPSGSVKRRRGDMLKVTSDDELKFVAIGMYV